MKRQILVMALLCLSLAGFSQADTLIKKSDQDTLHIGNMTIVRNGVDSSNYNSSSRHSHYYLNHKNITTNWLILDLGFANYNDRTNYSSAGAQQFAPGGTSDWFNLKYGKSIDVNIWLFIQRLNLIKHVVNLKYGLGIELNNYRYRSPLRYDKTANMFTEDLT